MFAPCARRPTYLYPEKLLMNLQKGVPVKGRLTYEELEQRVKELLKLYWRPHRSRVEPPHLPGMCKGAVFELCKGNVNEVGTAESC